MEKFELAVVLDEGAFFPEYGSELAAGADVRAFLKDLVVIQPSELALIPTGLSLEIPDGYEIQVRPRSGLALKFGITVLNTPGTIDAHYRGKVGVILINHGKEPFTVTPGMRIAQLVLAPVFQAVFVEKPSLMNTSRGDGGFGHTGTH